jgi:hypothetical protein
VDIYQLEIRFPYNKFYEDETPWVRVIEVKENMDLYSLHEYIQKIVEFDNDHLFQFYIKRNPRSLGQEVPEDALLNEIYPITGYKLYYLFDFGDSWLFEIKKSRKKITLDKRKKYPCLVKSQGANPEQY